MWSSFFASSYIQAFSLLWLILATFEHFIDNFSISYPFKGARAGHVCLFWFDSSFAHWVDAEWDFPSTESTRSETPRQLSQRRRHQHFLRFYHSALTHLTWSLTPHWADMESQLALTQLTGNETWRQLSHSQMLKNLISWWIQVQNQKRSKTLLFGQYTVGAMELARTIELARSLSNDILGKLHKEFRPDFFSGWSPTYWQQHRIFQNLLGFLKIIVGKKECFDWYDYWYNYTWYGNKLPAKHCSCNSQAAQNISANVVEMSCCPVSGNF